MNAPNHLISESSPYLLQHAYNPVHWYPWGEEALQKAGFTKVDVPETQLFPGEINRVSLYRKMVKAGERLQFGKLVLLVFGNGAAVE